MFNRQFKTVWFGGGQDAADDGMCGLEVNHIVGTAVARHTNKAIDAEWYTYETTGRQDKERR